MNCYVITLNPCYKSTDTYNTLINMGLNVIIIPGVIATDRDIAKYPFRPRVAIGIFIAHRNAWEAILKDDVSMALILEDDAIPICNNIDFASLLNMDFDILKLHSDNNNISSSAAAYIIKNDTAENFVNSFSVFNGHVDRDIWLNCWFKGLKLLMVDNLFITDENNSTNRIKNKSSIYSYIIDKFKSNDTKSHNDKINYSLFRLNNREITIRESITILVTLLAFLFFMVFKHKKLIIMFYVLFIIIYTLELF
jgi:hypothetical protein